MSQPLPTIGRIVLARSPKFQGEFPAIVVRTYAGVSEEHVDVQVFTDEDCGTLFLSAIAPQSESSKQWGWRWPPRVESTAGGTAFAEASAATAAAPSALPTSTSTLSQEEPLARV